MTREEADIFLRNIEIPSCSCKFILDCDCAERFGPGPCRAPIHLAERCCHILSMVLNNPLIRRVISWGPLVQYAFVRKWAALLLQRFPADYAEPPPPAHPMIVLKREARVAIMSKRESAGLGLRHPSDLRADQGSVDDLARRAGMTLNWRATEEELVGMTGWLKPVEEDYRIAVARMLEEWRGQRKAKSAKCA